MRFFKVLLVILAVFAIGCSGNTYTTTPDETAKVENTRGGNNHSCWGLWQFVADPVAQTLDVIPLRAGDFHINVIPFLEPPALVNLTLESIEFNGNLLEADIGVRHPFLGLTEFTGFDVCGVLITNGSVSGFADSGIVMAGPGDTRLLNADGHSRWWNPAEFPVNEGTMFSYNDGLLGTPDSFADYTSTLNGYKYFCDDLGPTDPLGNVTLEKRGMFSAGKKNVRHYTIDMSGGLIFNYAVDACWAFPGGSQPWVAPDDFPPAANRAEARNIVVNEITNTLYNDGSASGGELALNIDVYDWYNVALNTVKMESPGNFGLVTSPGPIDGGAGFSTYEIEILGATPAQGSIGVLISVESEAVGYGGILPGKPVTSYFIHTATVASECPSDWTFVLQDPVQIIDPVHGDWPQLDDFSPTIGETMDESLLALWFAVNDTHDIVGQYQGASNWGFKLYSFTSNNSGTSWGIGYGESFGVGAQLIVRDAIKSLQYISGSRMHALWPGYPPSSSPSNYVTKLGPQPNYGVYWKPKATRQAEAVVMADAKLVVMSDYGGVINAEISTGNNWDDPSPFWYSPFSDHPEHYVANGYLSNVRSLARDDDGKLWLVKYGSGSDISLYSSINGTTWSLEKNITAAAGYEDLRDPSIFIDGQEIYLTFTQKHTSPLWYELILIPVSSSIPEKVVQSSSSITDAEIISGNTIGEHLTAITYQAGGGVYCTWRMATGDFSTPVLVSKPDVEASMPDFIFDTVSSGPSDAYLHFVWCERADANDNWEVFYRRGYMM